jgi:hypothetical protein
MTPRDGLAEMIRHHYRTAGESATTEAAEKGLAAFDAMLATLERIVKLGNSEDTSLADFYFAAEDAEKALDETT